MGSCRGCRSTEPSPRTSSARTSASRSRLHTNRTWRRPRGCSQRCMKPGNCCLRQERTSRCRECRSTELVQSTSLECTTAQSRLHLYRTLRSRRWCSRSCTLARNCFPRQGWTGSCRECRPPELTPRTIARLPKSVCRPEPPQATRLFLISLLFPSRRAAVPLF